MLISVYFQQKNTLISVLTLNFKLNKSVNLSLRTRRLYQLKNLQDHPRVLVRLVRQLEPTWRHTIRPPTPLNAQPIADKRLFLNFLERTTFSLLSLKRRDFSICNCAIFAFQLLRFQLPWSASPNEVIFSRISLIKTGVFVCFNWWKSKLKFYSTTAVLVLFFFSICN